MTDAMNAAISELLETTAPDIAELIQLDIEINEAARAELVDAIAATAARHGIDPDELAYEAFQIYVAEFEREG